MDKRTCTDCGVDTPVKKDGSLWKHECVAAGENHSVTAQPLVFEALQQSQPQTPSGVQIDVAEGKGPSTQQKTQKHSVFSTVIVVKEPCIFLNDKKWLFENQLLVVRRAKDAGHKTSGEPRLIETEVAEGIRRLHYEVNVR